MHSKPTIQRWVSAIQEHIGSRATQIPVLFFPQRKQQKRHCCTDRHECGKPIDANKTPQMAHRFCLRPRLLCRLVLWSRFTSSCSISYIEELPHPTDFPSLWNSHRSSTKQMALSASILSYCSCCRCVCSRLQQIARAIANGGQAFWAA